MSLSQNVSHAFRSLRRAPIFSAAVILTLTIGIGSAAAIFAVVNAVLLRPLPFGQPERLVGAWFDLPPVSMQHAQQTLATFRTFQRFSHTLESIAIYDEESANIGDPDNVAQPERMIATWATSDLIPMLQVRPIVGRTFTASEDTPQGPRVALISEELWRSRFGGDRNVIGKKLLVFGQSTEIIGVMPSAFNFPSNATRLWLPRRVDPNDPNPGGFSHNAIARLKPGITIAAAERELMALLPRTVEVAPMVAPGIPMQMLLDQAKPVPRLIPLRDDMVGDISKTLWMVAATALLVLLVTCANVANLLLVRADGRHRELAVRAALGAGSRRVLAHFFTESAVLAGVSAILGVGVAGIAIRLLVSAGPAEIPRLSEISLDPAVGVFTVVVAFLVAVACSAIPAIRFMRSDALSGLRDGGRGGTVGGKRQRARAVLVAGQMALALVVLATSGLLLRSFQRLRAVRPGFNADGVATVWMSLPSLRYPNDSSIVRFYAQLSARAAALPGVQSVGLTSRLPLLSRGMNQNPMWVEGDVNASTKIPPLSLYTTVDDGYFRAMGVPLLAGRFFDKMDRQRGDENIISRETAIAYFHDSTGRAAIGKRFQSLPKGPWHTIIGVVGSIRDTSLASPASRAVYFPEAVPADTLDSQLSTTMALVARTEGDVASVSRAMQGLVRELDPTLPTFDVRSMQRRLDASIARLTFTMTILGVAAGVTLILGVVGLYGVIAYVVTLRTRELGVRIALGAQPRAVEAMVTKQGLMLSGAGIAVGLVLVLVGARFVRSFLYEITPADPLALGGATGLLVLFALFASWIPARRAARVNPTEALRAD
jgi:predicted permease